MKKTARSGCKINWFLKVTGKRPDGYHELATLFQYLPVPSDTIELDFDASSGIKVACGGPGLPQDLDNLAGKAALAYAQAAGIVPAWQIVIDKHVPSAAGLGGGSADAGTVLRMLEEHYGLLGKEKLISVAAKLGADIPFFLAPGLVFARGIGEKMTPYPLPEKQPDLLIVFPGFPVSAKWAYCALAPERISPVSPETEKNIIGAALAGDPEKLAQAMHNDLEYALFDKFPLLGVLREKLTENGALRVMVSGSGSSVIAVFKTPADRKKAAEKMKMLLQSDPLSAVFELGDPLI